MEASLLGLSEELAKLKIIQRQAEAEARFNPFAISRL